MPTVTCCLFCYTLMVHLLHGSFLLLWSPLFSPVVPASDPKSGN